MKLITNKRSYYHLSFMNISWHFAMIIKFSSLVGCSPLKVKWVHRDQQRPSMFTWVQPQGYRRFYQKRTIGTFMTFAGKLQMFYRIQTLRNVYRRICTVHHSLSPYVPIQQQLNSNLFRFPFLISHKEISRKQTYLPFPFTYIWFCSSQRWLNSCVIVFQLKVFWAWQLKTCRNQTDRQTRRFIPGYIHMVLTNELEDENQFFGQSQ